ncbi:TGS domain-containing protein [Candidatus Woesearchaeota archaeon]|nr:TGS domain-containing protein [Candidatus Woesearchaeota archaeon]
MPTNVTAEYVNAERDYQKASTTIEKLKGLDVMLREVPKHKGTETLRMEIKTKISKLKEKLIKEKEQKKKGHSLAIKKEGAAQVIFAGPPNTGKTSLLNFLSTSTYETAPYPHTTAKPNLGTLDYQSVKIQLIDLPPLIDDAAVKQAPYFAIVRNADLVLLIIDELKQLPSLLKEFADSHIILNKPKPDIVIKREATGGLTFVGEKFIKANLDDVKKLLREHNIANATIEIFNKVRLEDFFEILNERLAYLPALVVLNKQDLGGKTTKKGKFEIVPLSVTKKGNIERLKNKIWQKLNIIKIYTKEPGKKPSLKEPLTLKKGSSLRDMAQFIHKDFIKKFNYAKVWGTSAKHDGQTVGLEHQLKDNDTVEIHLK